MESCHRNLRWALGLCVIGVSLSVQPGHGRTQTKHRYNPFQPENHLFELGFFGGAFFPSDDHEFFDPTLQPRALDDLGPELGLRFAYLPLSFLGAEIEGAIIPMSTESSAATLWTVRGHAIGQIPWRLSPFAVVGAGFMSVNSRTAVLGKDTDATFHWGLGAKYAVSPSVSLRLDGRHIVAPAVNRPEIGSLTSHFEVLLGASLVLGRSGDPDPDKDGVPSPRDKCPTEPGVEPDGCPAKDNDNDGIINQKDKCPDEPGVAPDGCPDPDEDKDGIPIDRDECPTEAGVEPDGCPAQDLDGDGVAGKLDLCPDQAGPPPDGCPADTDGDGIVDDKDRCPSEPETVNGFQDADGCPDELPKAVKKFTGSIRGIVFKTGSTAILPRSYSVLNKAVQVLKDYPDLRIQISGHTDSVGSEALNMELSRERAVSVRTYIVDQGIDPDRIEATGFGETRPTATNSTRKGRAQNRRIEFKILHAGTQE